MHFNLTRIVTNHSYQSIRRRYNELLEDIEDLELRFERQWKLAGRGEDLSLEQLSRMINYRRKKAVKVDEELYEFLIKNKLI